MPDPYPDKAVWSSSNLLLLSIKVVTVKLRDRTLGLWYFFHVLPSNICISLALFFFGNIIGIHTFGPPLPISAYT